MYLSISSFPSSATRIAVSVLPLLLLMCVATDVAARQINTRSTVTNGESHENSPTPTFADVPDSPIIEKVPEVPGVTDDTVTMAEVSFELTDSSTGNGVPGSETTVAADAFDSAEFDFTSKDTTESTGSRWIQKIPRRRTSTRTRKSINSLDTEESAFKSPMKPMMLSQIISNVLYGPAWSTVHTNSKCSVDMKLYYTHMQNFTLWATKMLDATSKGPEGLLEGNIYSFGNFDQCMSAKSKNHGISGGYSLVDIDYRPTYEMYPRFYHDDHLDDYEELDDDESAWEAINHNIQEDYVQRHEFHWGICLPDTCNYNDVKQIVSDVLLPEMNRHGLEANVSIDPMLHTSSQNIYKYSAGFFLVCAMYLVLVLLTVVGTLYDLIFLYYRPKSEHGQMKYVLKPFSIISNIERLLKPSESDEFSIINGLKVCCILQVIPAHRWFMEAGNPQLNYQYIYTVIHNMFTGYFKCAIFLETFFVISGFLTFHIITKHLMDKKRLTFIPIMVYRWLRIFPVYATLIVTYIYILPYLNDGPYWRKLIYRESERCQSNWWTNLFFINNYVHTDELCIIPAWYLACDFHFFIIGTLLTYAIWKWRQQGLIMLGTLLTLSTIVPSYIIVSENQRGVLKMTPKVFEDFSKDEFFTGVYIKSHMRSMPYFIGILAGYLYMRLKEADYTFSLKSRIIWAPTALITGNLIYLITSLFYIIGHEYNAYEHALYFTVCRLLWSICIAYAIIGHGLSGFGVCISGFLGHRIFQVLGKLVFCIYMYQELIQLQTIGAMRTPTYENITLMSWRFGGDTFAAFMYAFIINVMIESPFDRVQKNFMKIIFGNKFSKQNSELSSNDTETKTKTLMA